MLRRLALTLPAALLAVCTAAAPASADYRVICVTVQETIEDMTGISFDITPPRQLPPYPNKACVPVFVEPPIDLPPIDPPPVNG